MTAPLLSIRNLSAVSEREDGAPILRDVSLTLERGQVMGLVGESGAGKSTIAKALLGILPRTIRVTHGEVLFEGRDLLHMPARQLRDVIGNEIALIPQDPQTALNPARRIGAQLTDGLRLKRGLSKREADARALKLLADVHIHEPERMLRSFPHELSGGMRQRIMIAAAFALEPKLVVADEPTTALDVTVQKQILRLIRSMQDQHGTAVICDHVTLLFGGKIIEQGTMQAVLQQPAHAYTRALINAVPRHDQPKAGLHPVPASVIDGLRRELGSSA
jgi:peptide/nickel transport system ATP-binding protein